MGERGLTQIYWGGGKGKTTTAMRTALRNSDKSIKIHLVQFMKNSPISELETMSKFYNFTYRQFGSDEIIKELSLSEIARVDEALWHLRQAMQEGKNIIIADDILYAVQTGLLKEQQIIDLIKSKPVETELILTGSHAAFPRIFAEADLVTEMKNKNEAVHKTQVSL